MPCHSAEMQLLPGDEQSVFPPTLRLYSPCHEFLCFVFHVLNAEASLPYSSHGTKWLIWLAFSLHHNLEVRGQCTNLCRPPHSTTVTVTISKSTKIQAITGLSPPAVIIKLGQLKNKGKPVFLHRCNQENGMITSI